MSRERDMSRPGPLVAYLPGLLLFAFSLVLLYIVHLVLSIASLLCPPPGGHCIWEVNTGLIDSIANGAFLGAAGLVLAAAVATCLVYRSRSRAAEHSKSSEPIKVEEQRETPFTVANGHSERKRQ